MTGAAPVAPARLFLHYLARLDAVLKAAEAFDASVGARRLHPDMVPLLLQASTAIGFTLRASCPLARRDIVSFRADDTTFAGVYAELERTAAYLAAIPDADFDGVGTLTVHTTAGFAELALPGWEYYQMYAVPNFFFHYAMVYAIARQAGVPVGKSEFDGYHRYPAGFAFGR
ncbi:DUF1993 domain-containing protein [Massilia pinisoli]|uniref:DUF1993 domain-containing protein n=1 Tax=Massilia pinisoli TaxID=1772194 RepID=A0ABT1ZZX4_9BURK|nr:DUF1993 domain-containing protein [Massilia pinisoli]MCS0585154.1 DUF1993 domain-containing protein [Massilia pinisoli]